MCTIHGCTDGGLREHGFHRLRKALETVHADNEEVLDATIFELGDRLQPELRALGLRHPRAQPFLLAMEVHTQCQVDGLDAHRATVTHLGMNAVEIDNRV